MDALLAEIKQDRVHVVADAWLTPAEAAEFALSVAALANQLSADRAGDAAALAAICADPVDVSMGLAAHTAATLDAIGEMPARDPMLDYDGPLKDRFGTWAR